MRILATTAFALALGVSGLASAQTSSGASGAGACQPGTAACQDAAPAAKPKDGASGAMNGNVQGEAKGQDARPQDKAAGGSSDTVVPGQADAGGKADQDQASQNKATQDKAAQGQAGEAGAGDAKQAGTSGGECKAGDPNCSRQGTQSDQATGEKKPETEQSAGEKSPESDTQQRAGETSGSSTERQVQDNQSGGQAEGESGTTASIPKVDITTEQKTEIKQIITTEKVEPVKIDVDVSVGVTVPHTVEVHRLPPRIVELVPAYRDYVYFVLVDGRIVVLEPDTYKVVVIIA